MPKIIDPRFDVVVLEKTPFPQRLIYKALRQDYSEGHVASPSDFEKSEKEYGELAVKHLLKGGRGHFGPLEHPQITVNAIGFPHDVMVQARTHRIGISFDVQSSRYSGQRIVDVANGELELESVFYARPAGLYFDRQGNKTQYTEEMRQEDLDLALITAKRYRDRLEQGVAPEAARQFVVQGFRQNFVMSVNLRSLLHFLDLRSKADAQPEIQALSDLLFNVSMDWCPEITQWYADNRLHKAQLSP